MQGLGFILEKLSGFYVVHTGDCIGTKQKTREDFHSSGFRGFMTIYFGRF